MRELEECEVERDFFKDMAKAAICERYSSNECSACVECGLKVGTYCELVEDEINEYVFDEESGEMVSREERDKRECVHCWRIQNKCPFPVTCANYRFVEAETA